MGVGSLPSGRKLRRFATITRVLAKHGLGDLVERLRGRARRRTEAASGQEPPARVAPVSPRRVRLILEELGPSFIKLGQLMSTRADIFPPEYVEELERLQDRVPPVPFPEVKGVVEKELGRTLEEVFAEFDPQSIAAASVGQVHLARLHSGDHVAVKVIRPGIGKRVREDIRLMYFLAGRIERVLEVGRILGLTNLVREFERTVFREMDMLVEAGSMDKFAHNFREVEEIHIPKVYWEFTTKSVLVMERIDGIKVDRVEEIRAHGIDPKEIAMIGLRSFSRQLMEFGFFHADPHPGNTIVLYDGRVALVDFGIIGYLDDEVMRQIANLFLGYAEHDYDMVMEALEEAGIVNDQAMDLAAFRNDLKDISEPFYGRSLQTVSVMDVYEQVVQLLYKYHIRLPRNLLLLLKTFIQTEALGKILGSDASILQVTRPYARKLLQRSYDARRMSGNLLRDARSTALYLRGMPKALSEILRQTARGKQRIELWHDGFEPLDRQIEKAASRLTVGLIISASLLAGAMVLNSDQKVMEFQVHFFGVHTLTLTAVLGVAGYVMAGILGLWLIISILRSRKL